MLYINRRLNKPIFCEVDMNSRERKEFGLVTINWTKKKIKETK